MFAAVFAIDLLLPLGVAGAVPYVAVILLAWWLPKRRHIIALAIVASVLTVAGYFYSPHGGIQWVVISNRCLALFAIWVTAILLARAKTAMARALEDNAVRESEKRLRTIFETSPFGIAIISLETNNRLYVNPAMVDLFGASSMTQLLERDLKTTYADPANLDRMRSKAGGEFITEIEVERKRLDGTKWWCLLTRRLIDYEGQSALIGWHYDITKRKQAEAKVKRLNEELEQRIKQRTEELQKSESLFRAVTDNSPAKIHIKDIEGRYLLINKEAEKLFGVTSEEGLGKTSYDLFEKDAADTFMAHDRKIIEAGEPVVEEEEFTREDGVHTYLTTKFPIFDLNGLVGVGAIGTDITARKQAEEARRQSEESYRAIVETQTELIRRCTPDGVRTFVNQAACRYFGHDLDEIIGTPSGTFILGEKFDLSEWNDRLKTLSPENPSIESEVKVRSAGNKVGWLHWIDTGIFDENGDLTEVQGVGRDITEQKQAELSLKESEERFRNVINNSPTFIALNDVDGRFKLINKAHTTLFGLEPQDIVGKHISEVLHKKVAKDVAIQDRKVLETKAVVVEERPIITDKGTFDYLVTKFPVLDEAGAVKEIGTIGVDISNLKKAEKALKSSEARLAGILDIAPEAVIAIGENLHIRLFNQGAERIFGYGAEEVMGKPLDMLMPQRSRNAHAKHVKTFDRSDNTHRLMNERTEISGLRKDGAEFPASASVSKLEIDGQKIYTVLLQDITQRKQAEKAVVLSKTEAEYANYAKTQFLANMSHELRTPLNSIIGFSQVLMGQGMGRLDFSQTSDYATNINDSANHLLAVIQDILDVSKIEAGQLDLDKEPVDFEKIIRDCMTMVKERADKGGVELSYKVAESAPSIEADELRLKQIFLNLLSNAIKFTPYGGKVKVTLEVGDDNTVLLMVTDTGIGIKKNDIPKILQPFGQVKDIMHRDHNGTGLGLSLAKSLTELHGGNLVITSEVGKGTTVIVQLPNGGP